MTMISFLLLLLLSYNYYIHPFRSVLTTLCNICSAFNNLLDDSPLPANEPSSSVLVATYSQSYLQGKCAVGGGSSLGCEVEKGLLTLISSDSSGFQVFFYLSL